MSNQRPTIVGLSAALTALAGGATALPAVAQASGHDSSQARMPGLGSQPTIVAQVGNDLMNFTVSDGEEGVVADHASHASHASHSSHSSHASHYSGR